MILAILLLGIMGVIVCCNMVSDTSGNEVVGAVVTKQVAEVRDGVMGEYCRNEEMGR